VAVILASGPEAYYCLRFRDIKMSTYNTGKCPAGNDSRTRHKLTSPCQGSPSTRKRKSRAGTRKVTSLTAEQLERKRANDREAQRTIRQRTREHIEYLERQVAELSVKGDQMDKLLQYNSLLEEEIGHLRQKISTLNGRVLKYADGKNAVYFISRATLVPFLRYWWQILTSGW
jgi:myosin heavy subunit